MAGSPALAAWASLQPDPNLTLLPGMTADVEVYAGEAYGVLQVPIAALRELAPGSYAVFVVQAAVGNMMPSQGSEIRGAVFEGELGAEADLGVEVEVQALVSKDGVAQPRRSVRGLELARTMIERTRGQVIILADHSKIGVVADFVSTPLDKVDILVTDAGINAEYVEELRALGVEVVVAEG